eukprot:COSAG02_NODE_1997_length_10152_cov_3.110315_7_plen_75_part_00
MGDRRRRIEEEMEVQNSTAVLLLCADELYGNSVRLGRCSRLSLVGAGTDGDAVNDGCRSERETGRCGGLPSRRY